MNTHPTLTRRGLTRAFALVGLSSLLGLSAAAQSAASSSGSEDSKDSTVKLDKFVVTGSYIPYAAGAPATAVQVLSSDDIAKSGVTGDLLEVLRKAVPQLIGGGNLGGSNSNIAGGLTNGGSQILLRNTSTLVLINGRRAAFAPVSATGGFTFVDVNAIPASAVQSIEVITDGASALYGSDAVSGVVNIKLKQTYDGTELGGSYKYATQKGHWEERTAHFTIGGHTDKTSVVVSGEWVKQDPLWQYERAISSPSFGTPTFAGVVQVGGTASGQYYLLSPSLNAPPSNLDLTAAQLVAQGIYTVNPATHAPYTFSEINEVFDLSRAVTLNLANQKKTVTASFEHQLGKDTQFFGDILYSKVSTFYQLNAQPLTDPTLQTHVAADPRNPFNITVRARNRFVDFPRMYFSDNDSLRALGGFRGKINDAISWEAAFNHNQVNQLYRNKNVINTANLQAAVAAGTINLFARTQAPGAIDNANIFGTAYANNVSKLNALDARVFGDLPFEMPAGTVQFALGGEVRREDLASEPDAGSLPNGTSGSPRVWTDATTFQQFSASRTIKSIYAEVRLPLAAPKQHLAGFYTMDIDIAARRDAYSDNESPTVPKVLLRWLPFSDEFALRASYSKSFIAPTLFQINGPSGYGVTPSITNINNFGGGVTANYGQPAYVTTSNPNLKPQRSTNYNLGIVYSPRHLKGLSVELSYFDLKLTDIIGAYAPQTMLQDVELRGAASVYAQYIAVNAFAGTPGAIPITAPGQIINPPGGGDIYVVGAAVNLAKQTQSGVDFALKYDFTAANLGRFSTSLGGTWYHSYKTYLPGQVIESVGWDEITNGTIPHWLANARVDFTRDNWGLGLGAQYIGAVDEVVIPDIVGHQASFVSVDARATYSFKDGFLKGLDLTLGANNVFDKGPPPAPTVYSGVNYDAVTYAAATLGRVVYISGSYKF
jgi:iron complex outermembrane receptor protein